MVFGKKTKKTEKEIVYNPNETFDMIVKFCEAQTTTNMTPSQKISIGVDQGITTGIDDNLATAEKQSILLACYDIAVMHAQNQKTKDVIKKYVNDTLQPATALAQYKFLPDYKQRNALRIKNRDRLSKVVTAILDDKYANSEAKLVEIYRCLHDAKRTPWGNQKAVIETDKGRKFVPHMTNKQFDLEQKKLAEAKRLRSTIVRRGAANLAGGAAYVATRVAGKNTASSAYKAAYGGVLGLAKSGDDFLKRQASKLKGTKSTKKVRGKSGSESSAPSTSTGTRSRYSSETSASSSGRHLDVPTPPSSPRKKN